jgi:polysaccharide pyruvyl transferase WcaK-like protein
MNRVKVGIVTFHSARSYGAVLQSFALKNYLEQNNCNVEIINYNALFKLKWPTGFWTLKTQFNISNLRSYFMFKKFRREYLNLGPSIRSISDKSLLDGKYDIVITGSDQVWNPVITKEHYLFYFLSDFKKSKKVSYAASFGNDKLRLNEDEKQLVKTTLMTFSSISVRENLGRALLRDLFLLDSEVVLDPTFLLSRSFYETRFGLKFLASKHKIVFFKLGYDGVFDEQLHILEQKLKLNVLISNARPKSREIDFISIPSVDSWLNCIYNAEFIITDSFHGLVFSLIFQKQFVVLNANKERFNRILNLLEILGLEDRILLDNSAQEICNLYFSPVDYVIIQNNLDLHIEASKEYLQKALF